MEISPAKSLGIVSDSEGEEERAEITMDAMFERELNAARSSDPRDWNYLNQPATIATNLSSHISQFNTLPGQATTMQTESSAISDFDSSATNARPRARPRMRPVPPPEQPSSIDAFSTMPTTVPSAPETVASFGNSMVQGVPIARPPSLPPSSLPGPDSSSMPIPTFPTSLSPLRSLANPLLPEFTAASSSVMLPTLGSESAPAAPKRLRPKMRPPPPPEPESTAATAIATTSSATTTSSSTGPNTTSTGATSVSSTNKSDPSRTSALDEAEEYRGRGARRIAQPSKPTLPPPSPDADVDVGGPEDNKVNDIIMLISSDEEYGGSKSKSKAKPKPKPKPKKKDAPKADSTPAQSDNPGKQVPPAKTASKNKSCKLLSSDDEFGKWDDRIPGGSAPTEKRKEAGVPDEGGASVQPVIPNTIDPPNPNPADAPGYTRATSSPLSSPGRSPELKRKDPPNAATGEPTAPSPTKKARKSGFVGVVLTGPSSDGKKPKRPRKKLAKATAAEDEGTANDQACVPPALSSVADTSTSVAPSESTKTKTTPPTSSGPSMVAQEPETAMDVDAAPAPAPAKKQPKKRAPKGKKGAVAEEPVVADGSAQEDPAPKKSAKGKGKGKGKEKEETPTSVVANDETTGAGSSNPEAGTAPGTSSNPSAAPAQTPAPKPKPKPRHSTTQAAMPVAMGASGSLLRSTSGKSTERPLSETIRNALGATGSPAPRMGLSRRGSSKIAPLLAFRGAPPPPPPPMPKKPTKKKKGVSDDEDSEEGPEWEGLTEKQKEKKRREKEMAGWYSDG